MMGLSATAVLLSAKLLMITVVGCGKPSLGKMIQSLISLVTLSLLFRLIGKRLPIDR
jgi:ABC-type iron transport system FetAB ATPase subunit